MAVGSQMSAIKSPEEAETYRLLEKKIQMELLLVILAVRQLLMMQKEPSIWWKLNALQIHLNVIQELTMPEGDRDFSGALKRIEEIISGIDVPVIVKEVGFGMNQESVQSFLPLVCRL